MKPARRTLPRRSPMLSLSAVALIGIAVGGAAATVRGWASGSAAPLVRYEPAPATAPAQATAVAAPAPRNPLLHLVAHARRGYRDGSYTGPVISAYYGWVQVQAVIRGGSLAAIRVLRYPSDRATSRRIAHIALPRLEREVIRAQSTRVDAVSGATLTSHAFLRSIGGALRRAAG